MRTGRNERWKWERQASEVSSLRGWMRGCSLWNGAALGSPLCSSLGRHSMPSHGVVAEPRAFHTVSSTHICSAWSLPVCWVCTRGETGLPFLWVRDGRWREDTAPCHIQFLFSSSHFLQNMNLTFFSDITGFTYCLRNATFPPTSNQMETRGRQRLCPLSSYLCP